MKKLSIILLSIVVMVISIVVFTTTAFAETYSGSCGNEVSYTLDTSTGNLIISGTGKMSDYTWGPAPWGSYASSITKASIQKGVTSIGNGAFNECVNLKTITVSESVNSIGVWSISGCSNLNAIEVDENNATYSDINGVLLTKDKKSLIFYPGGGEKTYIVPASVTDISEFSFSDCVGLTSITIGKGVSFIGDFAFDSCENLKTINLYKGSHAETYFLTNASFSSKIVYLSDSVAAAGITLDKITGTLAVGETLTLTATVIPSNATNKDVTWTSSDTSVATVSSTGIVTAVAEGETKITVKTEDGGKIANCMITVAPAAPSTYKITYDANGGTGAPETQIKTQDEPYIISDITPTLEGYTFLGWSATADGEVEYAPGASYTVNEDITLYAVWEVAPIAVTGINLDKTSESLNVGETLKLTVMITPSDAENNNVTWASSDTSVATVSSDGVITAVSSGAATITATTEDGGLTASCSITVSEATADDNADKKDNGGASIIAAIIIGAVVLVAMITVVVFVVRRRTIQKQK